MKLHFFCAKGHRPKKREIEDVCHTRDGDLFVKWHNMISCNKKVKIIKGSAEAVQNEYNNFQRSLDDNWLENDWLGKVSSIEAPCITSCANEIVMSIQYTIYELKDGCSLNEYEKAIAEYCNFRENEGLDTTYGLMDKALQAGIDKLLGDK